jgi:hypothetical protein
MRSRSAAHCNENGRKPFTEPLILSFRLDPVLQLAVLPLKLRNAAQRGPTRSNAGHSELFVDSTTEAEIAANSADARPVQPLHK